MRPQFSNTSQGKTFPVFTAEEVQNMVKSGDKCIITYDDGVFDCTEFAHHGELTMCCLQAWEG